MARRRDSTFTAMLTSAPELPDTVVRLSPRLEVALQLLQDALEAARGAGAARGNSPWK
jgi:hypothetical protein